MTRVGNLTERLDQRQRRHRGRTRVEGGLRVIEGGNDRGHLQCGHGLPDVIKDLDILMITSGPCPSCIPLTACRRRSATAHRDFASALREGALRLLEPLQKKLMRTNDKGLLGWLARSGS